MKVHDTKKHAAAELWKRLEFGPILRLSAANHPDLDIRKIEEIEAALNGQVRAWLASQIRPELLRLIPKEFQPSKAKPAPLAKQFVVERNGRYLTANALWSGRIQDAHHFDTIAGAQIFAQDYDGAKARPVPKTSLNIISVC